MLPELSDTELTQFAADTMSDVAIRRPVKRGGHHRKSGMKLADAQATGRHVGYPANTSLRVHDLSRRCQLAIRALERAGFSRREAAEWVAACILRPSALMHEGIPRGHTKWLKDQLEQIGVGRSRRGRKLKPLSKLSKDSPDSRKRRKEIAEQNPNPSRVTAREIAEIDAGINAARKARRGTPRSVAAALRAVPVRKRPSEADLEFELWQWWWVQPFRAGDVNPLTGRAIRGHEFPCGWSRMAVRALGWRFDRISGWVGGRKMNAREAERIAQRAGHLPVIASPGRARAAQGQYEPQQLRIR